MVGACVTGDAMYPEDIDPESGCRLPLPRREELDDAGRRTYDSLADPKGGTIEGLRGPGGYPAPQSRTLATCPAAQPLSATRGGTGRTRSRTRHPHHRLRARWPV